MNRSLTLRLVIGLLLVSMASMCRKAPEEQPEPPKFKTDHFKVYEAKKVEGPEIDGLVMLEDQFDRKLDKKEEVKLLAVEYFANPVSKNKEKLIDRAAHLTWYRFKDEAPRRSVVLSNQFHDDVGWVTGNPTFLLVPTQKLREANSVYPENLEHFKCYEAESDEPTNFQVSLKDQFDENPRSAVVVKAAYFCNPVSKNEKPIKNRRDHLACYYIEAEPIDPELKVEIKNQFGAATLVIGRSQMLCVPSEKVSFDPLQ